MQSEQSQSSAEKIAQAKELIAREAQAVLAVQASMDETFLTVADIFARCKGKILITGSGTSGIVAHRAAHLLSVGGTPAFYLAPADGLHGSLGVLNTQDWVLALSKGGGSEELNNFCQRAKTLCAGLVVITASLDSNLAMMADYVIKFSVPEGSDLGGVLATGSSLATAAITDALVESCRIARNYSWNKVLFTHPSGAVGRDAEQSLERLRRQSGA